MRTAALIVALLVASMPSTAARSERGKKLYDCEEQTRKAVDRYERGRYNDVIARLTDAQFQCGGHRIADTIAYFLGMAHLQAGHEVEAKSQFRRLVDGHSTSQYYEEAQFRMGMCSFLEGGTFDRDQTETVQAISELSDFVHMFPRSPWVDSAKVYLEKCYDKLAHKEFASAKFYDRIDKHDAAAVYYRSVIDDYPESEYAPEAHILLAESLAQINRITEARSVVEEVLGGEFSDDIKRRATMLQGQLTKE